MQVVCTNTLLATWHTATGAAVVVFGATTAAATVCLNVHTSLTRYKCYFARDKG